MKKLISIPIVAMMILVFIVGVNYGKSKVYVHENSYCRINGTFSYHKEAETIHVKNIKDVDCVSGTWQKVLISE